MDMNFGGHYPTQCSLVGWHPLVQLASCPLTCRPPDFCPQFSSSGWHFHFPLPLSGCEEEASTVFWSWFGYWKGHAGDSHCFSGCFVYACHCRTIEVALGCGGSRLRMGCTFFLPGQMQLSVALSLNSPFLP